MTTRERREAKAERLRGWAANRVEKAESGFSRADPYRGDTAFWTQPGRIIERERVFAAGERAAKDLNKAHEMGARAGGIEAQLAHTVFADDPDAIERLTERIEGLKAEQERLKAANVAFRAAHKTELKALTAYQRNEAMPAPTWRLSNLSADIRRNEARLAQIQAAKTSTKPLRVIQARRDGECERCGQAIAVGDYIGKYVDGWILLKSVDGAWAPACEE